MYLNVFLKKHPEELSIKNSIKVASEFFDIFIISELLIILFLKPLKNNYNITIGYLNLYSELISNLKPPSYNAVFKFCIEFSFEAFTKFKRRSSSSSLIGEKFLSLKFSILKSKELIFH